MQSSRSCTKNLTVPTGHLSNMDAKRWSAVNSAHDLTTRARVLQFLRMMGTSELECGHPNGFLKKSNGEWREPVGARGIHINIPYWIWGAIWSYLEFSNHLIVMHQIIKWRFLAGILGWTTKYFLDFVSRWWDFFGGSLQQILKAAQHSGDTKSQSIPKSWVDRQCCFQDETG